MAVAALVTWLVTAAGGFVLLGTWLARSGSRATAGAAQGSTAVAAGRAEATPTRFPRSLVFGHFGLAVAGLIVWIGYLATDSEGLGWAGFVILLPVALLGFTMFGRWLAGGGYRHRAGPYGTPPENHLPVPVVAGHGLLAATTLVLVLLAALGVGGS